MRALLILAFATSAFGEDVGLAVGRGIVVYFVKEAPRALYLSHGQAIDIGDERVEFSLVEKLEMLKQAYDIAQSDEDRAAIDQWASDLMQGVRE